MFALLEILVLVRFGYGKRLYLQQLDGMTRYYGEMFVSWVAIAK